MALTKEIIVSKIDSLELGELQVRVTTRVLEDGEVISESYHRNTFAPGDDVSGENAKVIAIANATWTDEVIAAYAAAMVAARPADAD